MGTLVDADTLRAELAGTPPPALLDIRWSLTGPPGVEEFAAGHVPGAAYVDLDTDLADPPGAGGRHPLPDPARFARAMRRAGVTLDRPVVVMDSREGTVAARAWWLLRHHGHDDVRLLDGGFAAWVRAGGQVATGPEAAPYGDEGPADGVRFRADEARLAVLDADDAAALADRGRLLDARAEARFRGEVEPVDPVAGHIPGAVPSPTLDLVDGDGRFLGIETLLRRFEAMGLLDGREVGVYCGSGVTASHEVLALSLLGVEASLYAGSWSHWIASGRPVATGPQHT